MSYVKNIYKCDKKCCSIEVLETSTSFIFPKKENKSKAGVLFFNPEDHRVILVQSIGETWGLPKGKMEKDETNYECAIREVREETGIEVEKKDFLKSIKIKKTVYFYTEKIIEKPLKIQDIKDNDVFGITNIKLSCLEDCISSGKIILSQQCKIALRYFLKKKFTNFPLFKKIKKRKDKWKL